MEWEDKGYAYASIYQSGRQAKDIWKYIPYKYWECIEDAVINGDGYWIYLEKGWVAYDGAEDCGMIHEYNIADLKNAIKSIRKYQN